MKRQRLTKLAVLPAAGVVATGATAVTAWTTAAAPAADGVAQAAPELDRAGPGGTFESCSAYFGLGKDVGVMDVVDFDVADQNGSDGVDHGVPADTQVVIVLTDDTGATLECTPVEITEQAWAEAMDQVNIPLPEGQSLPAWPGPGHYAYPTISYDPQIDGFGAVVATGFRVVTWADGHELVSPTGVEPLTQHFPFDPGEGWFVADPRVFAFVAERTSEDVAAAFAQAIADCGAGGEPDWTAAEDGANAIRAYRGFDPIAASDMGCGSNGNLYAETSVLLGLDATVAYTEPIVLALPDDATTSTAPTSSTSSRSVPQGPNGPTAPPATPVPAAARFTG